MPTATDTRGTRDSGDSNEERTDAQSRSASDASGRTRQRQGADSQGRRRQDPSDTGQRRRTRPQDTASGRRTSPSDTASGRRTSPSDTVSGRRVSPSDTASRRRQSPGDTGQRRRTRPQDTGSARRVAAGDTSAGRRISPSDTAARRRQDPSGTQGAKVTQSRSRGALEHTGSVALVSDTGAFRRQSQMNNGAYVDASLDGTTSSIDTRKRRMRGQKRRGTAPSRVRGAGKHVNHQRHTGFPIWALLLAVVVTVGIGAGAFFLIRNVVHPYEGADVPDGEPVVVAIPEGSSGSEIIAILLDAGVIHSTADFMSAVKTQNADQSLRSGTYTFRTGSNPNDVVFQLTQGPNSAEGQLQVPEGLTVSQLAALVESSLAIPADEFLAQAKASAYVGEYAFLGEAADDSLEGFLYPKTYDFAGKELSADTVIRSMLSQFETEMVGLDLEGAKRGLLDNYGLTVTDYDILKIASIIEKEAISEDDRPKVSSVFYNRLADGMALQSDATMSYVTGGTVTSDDLHQDSPYNTYYYKGLPPTPICTPSLWAIEAAMYPADTDYLFFFIIESEDYSNHTFSVTYEEHESAYAEALREQRAAIEGAQGDAAQPAEAEAPAEDAPVEEGSGE